LALTLFSDLLPSLQIRTHAAAAIAAPATRASWGGLYATAVEAVTEALVALDDGAPANTDGNNNSNDEVDFADLKCRPALRTQLTATLLHLLSLGRETDVVELGHTLALRAPVLEAAVLSTAVTIRDELRDDSLAGSYTPCICPVHCW
jgi:hypothetical protein